MYYLSDDHVRTQSIMFVANHNQWIHEPVEMTARFVWVR